MAGGGDQDPEYATLAYYFELKTMEEQEVQEGFSASPFLPKSKV